MLVTRIAIAGGLCGLGLIIAERLSKISDVKLVDMDSGVSLGSLWNTSIYSCFKDEHYTEDPRMHRDYLLGRKGNKPIKCSPKHRGRACKKKSKRGR
ncbi:hypothetical protein [Proteus phage 10]|nr:hypothetical protein [Proteus phage 10]